MPLANGDLAKAICDRCNMKRDYKELVSDRNSPGLRVCRDGCNDLYDPYRLPAPGPDPMQLRYPRPDVVLEDTRVFITTGDGSYVNANLAEGTEEEGDLSP